MLANAAWRTLQILFFRAGPQDFPFDAQLARLVPLLAVAGNVAFLSVVLPPAVAAVIAASMVLALALYTRTLLRAKNLLNRFQQTLNALLSADLALKLIMLPVFWLLAPKLAQLAQHPELLDQPEKLALPGGPVLALNLVSYWSFAVSANIYRRALDVGVLFAVLLTLLALFVLLFATTVASTLLRLVMV